jgi:hypothetical protein
MSLRFTFVLLLAAMLGQGVQADDGKTFHLRLKHTSEVIGPFVYVRGTTMEFHGAQFHIGKTGKLDGQDVFEVVSVKTGKAYGRFLLKLGQEVRLGPFAFEVSDPQAQIIQIILPGNQALSLAEVQVFSGGENVALKKIAHSSTIEGPAHADRAIDGNTNGIYDHGSVSHTIAGRAKPWWYLDLKKAYVIDKIVLWNRTDCCRDRLNGFTMKVMDKDERVLWQTTREDAAVDTIEIIPFR